MTTEQLTRGIELTNKIAKLEETLKKARSTRGQSDSCRRHESWGYTIERAFTGEEADRLANTIIRRLEQKKIQLEVELHTV